MLHKIRLGLLLVLFGFVSCNRAEKPNPCAELEPVRAKFKIEESVSYNWKYETDTVLSHPANKVIFTALEDYDSYEWKVGTDDRTFTQKTFQLFFPDFLGTIDVRLIAKRKPNKDCFPDDDGIDTLTKKLTIIPKELSKMLGEYEGHIVGKENDKFTVSVLYNSEWGYSIKNINKGCIGYPAPIQEWRRERGIKAYTGAEALHFDARTGTGNGEGCQMPRGTAKLKGNTIEIEFATGVYNAQAVDSYDWAYHKFIGVRK